MGRRKFVAAIAAVVILLPVAAVAATSLFTDVSDDSIFVEDINWMKISGITKGCNVAGTEYCPAENVTRQQMAALTHRLATSQVVDAKTSMDADLLDGKDSSVFVEHGDIVMATDGSNWTALGNAGPSVVENYGGSTFASADGDLRIGLSAPTSVDGIEYGLKSVEVCVKPASGGDVTQTSVYGSTAALQVLVLASDETDRTANSATSSPKQARSVRRQHRRLFGWRRQWAGRIAWGSLDVDTCGGPLGTARRDRQLRRPLQRATKSVSKGGRGTTSTTTLACSAHPSRPYRPTCRSPVVGVGQSRPGNCGGWLPRARGERAMRGSGPWNPNTILLEEPDLGVG